MMPTTPLPPNSLVLYKSRPGRISRIGPKKIEIVTDDGRRLSVRPKDVLLLHPGPLERLARLGRPDGDLDTAWEILAGESTTITELAELAFGEYTPGSAWSVWEAITDGLYFSGQPENVRGRLHSIPDSLTDRRTYRARCQCHGGDSSHRGRRKPEPASAGARGEAMIEYILICSIFGIG